jgi:hypothetical protein
LTAKSNKRKAIDEPKQHTQEKENVAQRFLSFKIVCLKYLVERLYYAKLFRNNLNRFTSIYYKTFWS